MILDARFQDGDDAPLRLIAQEVRDLEVMAALVQDAVFPITEMTYAKRQHRFALLLNRFRWEDIPAAKRTGRPFERVRSLLVFETVLGVRSQNIDRGAKDAVLSLLSIVFAPSDQGGGSIINMASVAGSVIAAPNRFVYGATKAGVIGLTKSIAADFVTKGIRANAICPGTVESPSLDQRLRDTGDYEAAKAAFIARQPIGRIAKAEEIANLVVYLASDESSYTTGVAHVIDGGWANI